MNIRGLLLGTAAALVAVSSARAADAVMAPEPEPVEYVRVCDAYGAGFFYIPGTETCLQISGYVWYQIGATDDDGAVTKTGNYWAFAADGWNKSVRARVNFDARSETEWGTLRSYIRLQADWNGAGDGPVAVDQAYIELGGLRMGYTESAWAETVNSISSYGSHTWGGLYYGYQQRALIQYNFSSNGLFGTLSLEDDALAGDGYMPDIVALLGYEGGWGAVWARVGYDESFDGTPRGAPFIGNNNGGFAASIGTQINVPNAPGSSFRLIGYYADGDHQYGAGSNFTRYATMGNSEWSVLASYYHQFNEKFGASVGVQYFNDFYNAGTDVGTGLDGWSADLGLVWTPITNFEVRTEVNYDKVETLDGTVSGYLRFTRFF